MSVSARRIGAIVRKELQEFRRNRSVVATMAVIPLIFVLNPLIQIFALPSSASGALSHTHVLLYMLGIPAVVPAVVAAYSVVGERQQGSLEPVLMTPIRREEFLLAKALAALVPALVISYVVYGAVLVTIELFARPAVAPALIHGPDLLAQVLFTPLLAGWSIWVGIAVSNRTSEARTAQQLGTLASVPSAIVVVLMAYDVIHPTLELALGSAALLLVLNGLGWAVTSAIFDRERLITGTR
jgi:ABC-type transport system involved in multi-copper enzyme maturation permease subunit